MMPQPPMAGVAGPLPHIELPVNPAHHQPFRAQAVQAIEYGRRAGWHPQQTHAVLLHLRDKYNHPSPAIVIVPEPRK